MFVGGGLLLGAVLGTLLFANGFFVNETTKPEPGLPLTIGSPAPDFSLGQLAGEKVSLSDFKGKPVIINFWATWCLPCKEEMPLLDKVTHQHAGQVVVLGVNVGEKAGLVEAYLKETEVTFPILLDSSEKVADMYFVRNFPMTFFVDADGVVRAQQIGLLQEKNLARYLATIGIEP